MVDLVRQARRRIAGNRVLEQGANVCIAVLAAWILLLIAGTQVLSWPVAAMLPAAAVVLGWYCVRRRIPSLYTAAQSVDARLGLGDALSTAVYFSELSGGSADAAVLRAQFDRAGELVRGVDARSAAPLVWPRTTWAVVLLAILAGGLFTLRYGQARRLDLRAPLATLLRGPLSGGHGRREADGIRRDSHRAEANTKERAEPKSGEPDNPGSQEAGQRRPPAGESPGNALSALNAPLIAVPKDAEVADREMASDDPDPTSSNSGFKRESDEASAGKSSGASRLSPEKAQSGQQEQAERRGEDSSLMGKLKDAFENLLSRVKPQSGQRAGGKQGREQKGLPSRSPGAPQQGGRDRDSQSGQPGDSREGDRGQAAQSSDPSQQGNGQGRSDADPPGKQPGSGIGSQDGDKSIRDAGQLAAMGKLSEILGKRAANISGEATVEVRQTRQQLRTPYAEQSARHTQSGAEIDRDEVPVALQPYVQQYFDRVRRQPEAAGKK